MKFALLDLCLLNATYLASSIKRATADYIQDNAVDRLCHDCFSLADATESLGYRERHPKLE
jgi:hypothetical protein